MKPYSAALADASSKFLNLFRRLFKKPSQRISLSSEGELPVVSQPQEETQVEPLKGNDNMAIMKCSVDQANRLLNARMKDAYTRKKIKKEVFAELRKQFGVPAGIKFVIAIESPDNPDYCVLRNKHTRKALDDGTGTPAPVVQVAVAAPATAAVAEVAAVVAKVAAKKAASVKAAVKTAPAKKTAVKSAAKTAPAKKEVVKSAAKTAPAKKTAVKVAAKAPAKPAAKKVAAKPVAKKAAPAKKTAK